LLDEIGLKLASNYGESSPIIAQTSFLDILISLVPWVADWPFAITSINEHLLVISGIFERPALSAELATRIRNVFSLLLPAIGRLAESDRVRLGCLAVHFLNQVLERRFLPPTDIYQFGLVCLRLYGECGLEGGESYQFSVIHGFVTWTIETFPTQSFGRCARDPRPFFEQPLRALFFAAFPDLATTPPPTFSKHVTQLTLGMTRIFATFKNGPEMTRPHLRYLEAKRALLSNEQYRTATAVIIYFANLISLSFLQTESGIDWSTLIAIQLYPEETRLRFVTATWRGVWREESVQSR
jgi:hypothetical protein